MGKLVAEIRGPCSLLSLVFVTEKGETAAAKTEIPRYRKHGPRLTRVRLCQRGLSRYAQGGKVRASEIVIPRGSAQVEERWE